MHLCVLAVQVYPRSLISIPVENAYVCNFLEQYSNLIGLILFRFRDIASFLLKTATTSLFETKFGDVPLD